MNTLLRCACVLALLSIAGCKAGGDEHCTGWVGGGVASTWNQCGDNKVRKLQCEMPAPSSTPGTEVECKCLLDGVAGKTFKTTEPSIAGDANRGLALANTNCGWKLSR